MLTYLVQPDLIDEARRSTRGLCSMRGLIQNMVMRGSSTSVISSVAALLCRPGMRIGEAFTQLSS